MLALARNPNNEDQALRVNADGELLTAAVLDATGLEIPPPVGGATEAKQDDAIALLGGGLPAALTASGNIKVSIEESTGGGLTDTELRASAVPVSLAALPALTTGTATIGATKPAGLTAKGYQQITALSAAATLTVPSGSTCAIIQAESQDVRWRDDGTNPTASVGMVLATGAEIFYTGALAAFAAIETAASAKLNISYYG
jgi:hypothetical protein